jgi:(p)ppGpp synthase/HD superfamily hydrolase
MLGPNMGTAASIRYGARFARALEFATTSHEHQERKSVGAPYITHPLAVASLVGEYGGDEDQAIAALLHDVMEDCHVTRAQLRADFGETVARIVVACTDTTVLPKPPWRERKEAHLEHVRGEPGRVKLVIAADKLHNASCIVRDLHRKSVGQLVWSRFRATKDEVIWYYRAMTEALGVGWQSELLDELGRTVAQLH